MPLEGQWARQHSPLRRRERLTLGITVPTLAAAATALLFTIHGSAVPAPGCIDATVPSTTGGAAIHACGAQARTLCAAPRLPAAIREPCRSADRAQAARSGGR